jgi:hypothetical protein
MPTGRLTMRRIRDVLRLKFAQGLSERAIAASLGLGKGSVGAYLRRAREAGLNWPPMFREIRTISADTRTGLPSPTTAWSVQTRTPWPSAGKTIGSSAAIA